MGMYDELICKAKLPLSDELKALNVEWNEIIFQTKDLDNCLSKYTITEEGSLVENVVKYEYTYFTEEEKKSPNHRPWNIVKDQKVIEEYTKTVDFHGSVTFYDILKVSDIEDIWIDFRAFFIYGKLDKIELIKAEKQTSRNLENEKWFEKRRQIENSVLYKCKTYFGWFAFWRFIGKVSYKISSLFAIIHSASIRRLSLFLLLALSVSTINLFAQTNSTKNLKEYIILKDKKTNATKINLYNTSEYGINVANITHDYLDNFQRPINTTIVFTTLEIEF